MKTFILLWQAFAQWLLIDISIYQQKNCRSEEDKNEKTPFSSLKFKVGRA